MEITEKIYKKKKTRSPSDSEHELRHFLYRTLMYHWWVWEIRDAKKSMVIPEKKVIVTRTGAVRADARH